MMNQKKIILISIFGSVVLVLLSLVFVSQLRGLPRISVQNTPTDSRWGGDSVVGVPLEKSVYESQVVGNMTQERKVSTNYVSVHVESVVELHNALTQAVTTSGGKVMNEQVTVATDSEGQDGVMTVLLPNEVVQQFSEELRTLSLKIVDRQETSYQITQEYTDIKRQLAQYEETYKKVKEFYQKATTVRELLEVQANLDQVQRTIDSLKGRQQALDELSQNTQYTIYSSTNEYNLPYLPEGTFEIGKTFKLAVRSLVGTTDILMKGIIYLVVYLPLIAVVSIAFSLIVRKVLHKKEK